MPGKVAVKIKAGRNLPVMDRSSDTTDAFVEIKLGSVTQKTEVFRKSLNPQWNTDWFRFEVDDAELQDEPLQIRLMDHDTYSANDAIGKVNISLNPLCLETGHPSISGWIPVFDTMHGIRGEVNVIVKVDLFSDVNKFRQSSCGIPFFHSQCVPFGYRAQVIHGFVEELVVNDDPEYAWIDKIRTPRASNEARQVVFLKLSGQVQRKMGLKAINLGANAVIGYTQCFDLEGDVGVVARGIGTAVTLIKDTSSSSSAGGGVGSGSGQPVSVDNALIEESTVKYLAFLRGSGVALSVRPQYKLHINRSDPATLYALRPHNDDDEAAELDDDALLMGDLMRQEDERGEQPSSRKLRHRMRRLTHSSRNLFNAKYNAFMRRISDNAGLMRTPSRSLSSLLLGSSIKEERSSGSLTSATPRTGGDDAVQRRALHSSPIAAARSPSRPPPMKTTSHPIVRSVSDDSAMKPKHDASGDSGATPAAAVVVVDAVNSVAIAEFLDSTRSSPNICSTTRRGQQHGSGAQPFGQFCKHDTHLMLAARAVSSSSSLSAEDEEDDEDDDESSSSTTSEQLALQLVPPVEDVAPAAATTSEQRAKVERLLRSNAADDEAAYWIRPGSDHATEDEAQPSAATPARHSFLRSFSHQLQAFIHHKRPQQALSVMPPTVMAALDLAAGANRRRQLPPLAGLLLSAEMRQQRYYSSQPEMLNALADAWPAVAPARLTASRSMEQLTAAFAAAPLPASSATVAALPQHRCPVLCICPSTPTGGEAELDAERHQGVAIASSAPADRHSAIISPLPLAPLSSAASCTPLVPGPPAPAIELLPLPHSSSSTSSSHNRNCTNLSSSLLAPFMSSFDQLPTASPSHPSNRAPHQQTHSRSLSELSGGGGNSSGSGTLTTSAVTDSPSLKRHTSPAAAAIVAAASNVNPFGSHSKLTPSPARMAAQSQQQQQGDNGASTTVQATATPTTMPKEMSEMCRRSSDSDLSVTPKGNSICVASERLVAATAMMRLSQPIAGKGANATDNLDMLEYPFLTMTKYPLGFILHLGATVAARSVKLLERVPNPDEPEVRDSWWTELRMEIRSHARALCCNVVLGYSESTTISDDVCVLSATGTAAVINMAYNRTVSQTDIIAISKGAGAGISTSLEERDMLKAGGEALLAKEPAFLPSNGTASATASKRASAAPTPPPPVAVNSALLARSACSICHIPYSVASVPFNVKMKKCGVCRKGRVPDVLMATLEVPEHLPVTGRGCFMQAQVVRAKKDLRSELNAKEISDGLPFLEYELHRLLINKLKAKGMNAIFGLRAQVAIGERMIALIATGTALFLGALPVPLVPKIVAGNSWTDKQKLNELQKKLQETYERNQEVYQLRCLDPDLVAATVAAPTTAGAGTPLERHSDTESDDEVIEIDLNCGNKDTCVLEVDDIEDLEIISLLMEPYAPEGFHVVNTQVVPGMAEIDAVKNLQMFTQVWRAKLDVNQNINSFPKHFQRLLQTIYFKLRSILPCVICDLRFRLDLPESDQIQLLVTGMALGLNDGGGAKLKAPQQRPTVDIVAAQANGGDMNGSGATPTTTGSGASSGGGGSGGYKRALQEEDYIFPLDEDQMVDTPTPTSNLPPLGSYSLKLRKTSPSRTASKANATIMRSRYFPLRDRYGIDVTPLSYVPGGRIDKYLGNLNFFFIRESTSIRENGGISGFVHGFITELLAVVRAHVGALGGNAMVSFYMNELILVDSQHKNQGQCLISIGGDAVYVVYHTDD